VAGRSPSPVGGPLFSQVGEGRLGAVGLPPPNPLYLARAGLHHLTDGDHQAVREVTRHLDPATLRQVTGWLERTRRAALALRGAEQVPPARPGTRRSWF